jgi:signal transduction histidine kinase
VRGADEFAELARTFNDMTRDLSRHQAQLIEANRLASIGQVASGVAHEINNPLGIILGYAVLLRGDPALGGRDELTIIEDEVRQCQRIVAGLLDLARPVRLHHADVELGEVVREAVSRLDESGQTGEVSIALDEPAHPVAMRADENRLRQILVNLLVNAVEAAGHGGATGGVAVRWRPDGARVVLEVLDRGPGIAPQALPRLFEPFFSTKAKGHGLGLAIARSLARAHGGDIAVGPRGDGPGTRAALELPLRPESEAAA